MSIAIEAQETHAKLKMLDPALAAMWLADFVDEQTTKVEAAYREYQQIASSISLDLQKQKLKVYYACKQKDKAKCQTELDSFMKKSKAFLEEVSKGGVSAIAYMNTGDVYKGEQDSENVRRMTESLKNAVEVLDFIVSNLD